MIVAGIDPGKSGAMAIIHADNSVEFFDVPRICLKGRDKPAWSEWSRLWCMALDLAIPDMVVIESVAARPGQGVSSMFTFGQTLGFVHGLVAATASCPIHFVTPNVWKGKMGLLKSDKGASREKCRNLYPSASPSLARVKDDGRAEAALLAHYGKKFI